MKKGVLKKVLLGIGSVFLLLVLVLAVHIYIVTRPKAPDAHTIVMARVDVKQDMSKADAEQIQAWMYQQTGIDHVLINPTTDIIIFTFFPVKANGDEIVSRLKEKFNLKASRYVPTEAELKGGCPVAATSFSYKAYNFVRHIF